MRIIFIILVLFFVGITQTTFIPKLAVYGIFPNLMLVIIILRSLFKKYKEIFIWPLAGGVILDIQSYLPLGVFTLSFLIISLLVSFLSRNIWSSESIGLVLLLLTLLASLILGAGGVFFTKIGNLANFSWVFDFRGALIVIVSQTLYNAALMMVLFFVVSKLKVPIKGIRV